jgi:hypothetical protein
MYEIKSYQNNLSLLTDLSDGTQYLIEDDNIIDILTNYQYRRYLKGQKEFEINADSLDVGCLIRLGNIIE